MEVPHFEALAGQQWVLLGKSGSGKTTLLHVLAGLLKPLEGEVTLAGTSLYGISDAERDAFRARHVGIVFQQLHLFATLTVEQNILMAPWLAGGRQDRVRAQMLLERLGLGDRAGAFPHELSQGQRQRVVLARAVFNSPSLLLADEPTSALDDYHADAVAHLLQETASEAGATLLIATHDTRITQRFSNVLHLDAPAQV